MPRSVAEIISGLSGGVAFLLLYVGLDFSLVIALVIAGRNASYPAALLKPYRRE